ncbi:MAG: T9SS type A sorting domain-containing protein [Melioribacteraceae bacterium]|nr:T9SS type A sorting domain-containing protein [Melioribacteraceae bacterium]
MRRNSFFILIFVFAGTLNAQWIQTNGPFVYNYPKNVSIEDNEVYITADYYSVYKLLNGKWIWVADPNTTEVKPTNVLKHRSKIIINDNFGGPLKISNDGGISWNTIINGMPSSQSGSWGSLPPSTVVSMGSVKNNIFVGFYDGLYRSTDEGVSWQKVLNAIVKCIASKDSTIYISGNGTYKSTDGGKTWIDIGKNGNMSWTTISMLVTSKYIFISAPNGVFRSEDDGLTWQSLTVLPLNRNYYLYSMVEKNNKLYATQNRELIFSMDFGETWENVSGVTGSTGLNFICTDKIYVSTNIGIFSSDDDGSTWEKENDGLEYIHSAVQSIAIKDSSILMNSDTGIYKSNDHGQNWNKIKNLGGTLFVDGSTIYSGLSKSIDNGMTWISISNGLPSFRTLWSIIKKDGILFLGTSEGVYKSLDDGTTWTVSNNGFTPVSEIYSMISYNVNIYVSNWFGVYKSTDNGNSWTYIGLNNIKALASGNNYIYSGSFDSQNQDFQKLYRMSLTNQQWQEVLTTNNVQTIATSGQNIFVGTEKGILLSIDEGLTWREFNEGIGKTQITCFAISDRYVYAGTKDHSVWKRPLAEIITNLDSKEKETPSFFYLSQNYPNPFNPETTISYTIPKGAHVTLKVHDSLGREIKTLVNEEKSPGNYKVLFSGTSLTSGVYFYRLQCGSHSETKKLVLMK